MTHMHIPDGILPIWLWVVGFIIMAFALAFSLYRLRAIDKKKKIPLLSALSAAMLVGMSLPILPGYHINLTVVTGILIGPSLGFVAAFIANLILALMGHGGITVIGLNTLLLGSEAVLGHSLFYLFKRLPVFPRAALATMVTLFITTTILIGIVAISHIDLEMLHHGQETSHGSQTKGSVSTFALVVLSVGVFGWIIEAAITGAVVKFISQVKPDLLGHALHKGKDSGIQ
ncbi:MAG TPA: energy-coupling factor ABC transporter permease [Nitrospirota bacterium]|nr:energy-coupling factor ABC transporter permease [Nitrospirota bacterium]